MPAAPGKAASPSMSPATGCTCASRRRGPSSRVCLPPMSWSASSGARGSSRTGLCWHIRFRPTCTGYRSRWCRSVWSNSWRRASGRRVVSGLRRPSRRSRRLASAGGSLGTSSCRTTPSCGACIRTSSPAEWVSRYIPVPDVTQVIGGAIGVPQEGLGYNASFLYPRAGGIDALPRRLAAGLPAGTEVLLGSDVEAIDPGRRRVKLTAEADWRDYHALISTIPLPELVRRIVGAPAEVSRPPRPLRWVRWRWLDVATRDACAGRLSLGLRARDALPVLSRRRLHATRSPAWRRRAAAASTSSSATRDGPRSTSPAVLRALVEVGALASSTTCCSPRSAGPSTPTWCSTTPTRARRGRSSAGSRPSGSAAAGATARGSTTRWRTA